MMRIAMFGLVLTVTMGCQSPCCRQRASGPPPGVYVRPGAPTPYAPGPIPGAGCPTPLVPGAAPGNQTQFPTAPSGPVAAPNFPPTGGAPAFPTAPPAPTPSGIPGAQGKIESNWQPAEARSPSSSEGRVLLAPPEPVPGEPPVKDPPKKQLYPPQSEETVNPVPKLPGPALPVGIPQFANVTKQVAAGLRPAVEGGLDWLQANKFRTLLHLHLPGEDNAADKKQIEERGLKFRSLEVSPRLLTKETVDEFFQLVRDQEGQPLFVYDRDGALAGGLWYLWFRLVAEMPDDVARIRARALGLREDREGAHRDMWQTTQRYLADLRAR